MATALKSPLRPPRTFWEVVKATYKEWSDDDAARIAAAVAYYAIFSMGPLLLIGITLVGLFYGEKAAKGQIKSYIAQFVGENSAGFLQEMVATAGKSPGLSFAGILSILLLIYAATNIFITLQRALNTVFDVTPNPGRGWKGLIKDRAMSFIMVIGIGAFMLASIVLNTLLANFTKWGSHYVFPQYPVVASVLIEVISFIVSCGVFTVVFAMIFKYLPDVRLPWRETWIGAGVTSVLFTAARVGLSYYFARSSTAGPFGAAGSLVVLMLFIYYSAQILFMGAEFTEVWASRKGLPIKSSPNAKCNHRKFKARGNPPPEDAKRKARHWWRSNPRETDSNERHRTLRGVWQHQESL